LRTKKQLLNTLFLLISVSVLSQNITLYEQINGRYDFTFIGNTLNSAENNPSISFVTETSSAAVLNMNSSDVISRAYLYWAGSGDGDFEVKLNGITINASRTFSHERVYNGNTFSYFSAFKDITSFVTSTGNGTYTLSDLDISEFEGLHYTRKTNFAGWAILIVYQNEQLPLNQLNIYDGLQGVPDNLVINLTNLFVSNNANARAGFIAWEGDSQLPTETFNVNGISISNALNPINNVFNSTNSVTGSTTLHNMDLDIYEIDDYIAIGDTNATITLSSSQDFIMINTVITKLNSQLPDATITFENTLKDCNLRTVKIKYTVSNINSTAVLPTNTKITFYANGTAVGTSATQNEISIGGSEEGEITLQIPTEIPSDFELKAIVDDQNGSSFVYELNEQNNDFQQTINFGIPPTFNSLNPLISCNIGFTKGIFDFSSYSNLVKTNALHQVSFHENFEDATANANEITNSISYLATSTPKEIYVRIYDGNCYAITTFQLKTNNCLPIVYNLVTANNDQSNDVFFIEGLRDIFLDFRIEIYNRWGKHLWTGDQNKPDWDGFVADGIGKEKAPAGTYFYILYLNDPDYPKPINGYLYLTY